MSADKRNIKESETNKHNEQGIGEEEIRAYENYPIGVKGSIFGSIVTAIISVSTVATANNSAEQVANMSSFAKSNSTAVFIGGAVVTFFSLVLTTVFATSAIQNSINMKHSAKKMGMSLKEYKGMMAEQSTKGQKNNQHEI